MRLLFIAIASSVLLAAIVTGINLRFLADAPIIAFIVTTVAMFIVAVVNARVALRTYAAAAQANAGNKPARNNNRSNNRSKQDGKGESGGRSRRGGRGSGDAAKGKPEPRKDAAKPAASKPASGGPSGDAPVHEGTPVTGEYETGEVKWFSRSKGFGFIVRPNGEEIFVHHRSVRAEGERRPSLRDGEPVRYIVTDHDKGLQAEDVTAA